MVGLLERARWFGIHETGDTRKPKGRYLAVRKEARAGRAGRPGRVLQRPRVYQFTWGIFERLKARTKVLYRYVREARYKRRQWLEPAAEKAGRRFEDLFFKNLDRALK